MMDLLNFAVKFLRVGGRLVYWLPTTRDYSEDGSSFNPPPASIVVPSRSCQAPSLAFVHANIQPPTDSTHVQRWCARD